MQSERGTPTPVAWTRLRAPQSSMEPMEAAAMSSAIASSPLSTRYGAAVDRESAYELLSARAAAAQAQEAKEEAAREAQERADDAAKEAKRSAPRRSTSRTSPLDSLLRSAGTQLGREITRTIFGTRRR